MRCRALCAFREPFGDTAVEGLFPGHEVDVPPELVERLASEGHIEQPAPGPEANWAISDNGDAQAPYRGSEGVRQSRPAARRRS